MKKLLPLMFALTVILASCSKERKLNRKLDGEWKIVTVDGMAPEPGESSVMSFDKDKKDDGSCTWTFTDATGSEISNGKYELNKDEKITITWSDGELDTMTVADYDKKNMTITTTETFGGTTFLITIVLEKK